MDQALSELSAAADFFIGLCARTPISSRKSNLAITRSYTNIFTKAVAVSISID
jgi:hypothetical protein